ncbi:hypothetical protein D3C77_653860 [compost metagenome]
MNTKSVCTPCSFSSTRNSKVPRLRYSTLAAIFFAAARMAARSVALSTGLGAISTTF